MKGNIMAKQAGSKSVFSAKVIVEKADALVKQREDFEQNEYARSNWWALLIHLSTSLNGNHQMKFWLY